jgi:hypothetical protein
VQLEVPPVHAALGGSYGELQRPVCLSDPSVFNIRESSLYRGWFQVDWTLREGVLLFGSYLYHRLDQGPFLWDPSAYPEQVDLHLLAAGVLLSW